MKLLFWIFVAILWSPFECIYMVFTQSLTNIGMYIAEKINES